MSIKKSIENIIKNKSEAHKFNKNYLDTQNVLKEKVGYSAQSIFSPTVLSWLFVIVTMFLQLISLSTTYSGSKVYFGGIYLPFGLSAPLLFAISIQLTVFSLSNSLKKNLRVWVIIILFFATLCSTYFSYIGIYNYINSPIQYLEERYNQIHNNMSSKYRVIIDSSKTEMKEYVFDITSKVQKEYTRLVKENDKYNKLSGQVSNVERNGNAISANTGSVAKPNIDNYGEDLNQYYRDMANYNAAISNMVGNAAQENASLQSSLYENEIKTILGGKSLDQFTKEHIDLQSNKEMLENLVSSMYSQISKNENVEFDKKINEIQQYCINYINSKEGDIEVFNTILTNMYTIYSDVTSYKTPEGFYNALNSLLTINDNNETLMKSLNDIEKDVYHENYGEDLPENMSLSLTDALLLCSKFQSEIKNGAYILNSISDKGAIIDLNSEEFVLENMYVLPMKNLFTKNSSLGMAWFCLAFAALIDDLTLLFALIQKENTCTLLAKENSDLVKNNEELTEELLLSSLILHPIRDEKKSTVQLSLEHLAKFLTSFEITSIGMENGYSLYCPLEKLKEYQIFLSVLCQFNLAKIISKEDYNLLEIYPTINEFKQVIQKESSVEALDEAAADIYEDKNESYILLKTKFIIWANQKFAIASSNKELSDIIINILKDIEETNSFN